LAIAVVLLVVGLWLAHELTASSKMQDCLMSGRTNCNTIETPQWIRTVAGLSVPDGRSFSILTDYLIARWSLFPTYATGRGLIASQQRTTKGNTTMRKIVLTVFGAALIAASTAQVATAAERHHVRKFERVPTRMNQQFRNANDAIARPAWSRGSAAAISDYSEGHVISAPAGY
jgi:hypothetical protein